MSENTDPGGQQKRPPDPGLVMAIETAITCESHIRNTECDERAAWVVLMHGCHQLLLCNNCYADMVTSLYPMRTVECTRCQRDYTPGLSLITGASKL